ncbi:hypothetical protein Bca52824_029930 [Brassica carinata]|uniref:Neprosin activation peptide domain-containing protein n=1 Tax=Brassica carinata TaxID=52824 RepID=A0A8X7S6A5_BRACI|nr:hypothetical protein Bca52824_029930 [Brassica carinata]
MVVVLDFGSSVIHDFPLKRQKITLKATSIVHSNQNTVPLRSFKVSENVTYDCIDIYKQPGLKHPLLKTHKIQMKSSISRPELKMQTGKNETSNKRKIVCPNGSVPILRNTKEYVTNSQVFAEKHFHSLSADSPGTHINPGLYGDQRVWSFGFWKGKDGKGCYNTACSGFVQVSKVIPIVEPIDLEPGVPGWFRYSIHQVNIHNQLYKQTSD